jgi:hypothetical protein
MTKSAEERELPADDVSRANSEDALIARLTAKQRAGQDTTDEVKAVLKVAAKKNRAALDRLAK